MKIKKPYLIVFLWLLLAGSGFSVCLLAGSYLYLSPQLPSVASLRDVQLQTPLRIYSADGKLIGEFGEKRRTPIKYNDIPQNYIDALLAAEDAQFYSHHGVSIKGLMRASSQLLMTGRKQSGGSTITMQVARNFFLSRRQTFARKFNEILLALRIERELSKEEILELYVNVIFLGNRAYGIEAAAQVYYGKPLKDLSLAQNAMIAALPKAPSSINPIANPERALQRRNWILGRMKTLKMIDDATYQTSVSEPITAVYHGNNLDINASYVAEMARKKAIDLFGLAAYTEGFRVYTTIDSHLQTTAQEAVVNGLINYDQRHGYRGPEQTLSAGDTVPNNSDSVSSEDGERLQTPSDYNENNTASTLADLDYSAWQNTLKDIPTYGGLKPAAVTAVNEKDVSILFANGDRGQILWEDGISNAREYINENSRGPRPKLAQDVLAVGDVIRVMPKDDGGWLLRQIPNAQAALVSLSPDNGAILSLAGGFDFRQSHFNRVTQAQRQTGSAFKPFVYTSALENGMTPATLINDAPIVFEDDLLESTWRPDNSDKKFEGPMRLRKALYRSRNLVSIRILRNIGIGKALRSMDRFGFDVQALPKDLSLALGSQSLTPMEIATGYAVFANGGYKVEPYLIERILDFDGRSVYEALPKTVCRGCDEEEVATEARQYYGLSETLANENEENPNAPYEFHEDAFEVSLDMKILLDILEPQDFPRAPKVLDDDIVYIMDSMLKDVIKRGTGIRAKRIGRSDLAGKTGTTNGPTDTWFSGYNHHIVTTTWLGFDQNFNLGRREFGGSTALPIWIEYMQEALKGVPESTRPQPPGVVTAKIDPETGKRARIGDPDAIFEYFRSQNLPEMQDAPSQGLPVYDNEERLTEEIF